MDWFGRAGSLLLELPRFGSARASTAFFFIGTHGCHGDSLKDSLTDVVTLVKRKPRFAQLVLVGDWNVDLLPNMAYDPWASLPGREDSHRERRATLTQFCDSVHVDIKIPEIIVSTPGGEFNEVALGVPITRIPVGDKASTDLPSLLDYFMQSRNNDIFTDTWIDWIPAVADHALLAARARCFEIVRTPRRGRWQVADWDDAVGWMAFNADNMGNCKSASSCTSFFLRAQDERQDKRSCAQRRAGRIPPHVRTIFQQIGSSSNAAERQSLRHYAGTLLRAHRAAKDEERANSIVKTGKVFQKSKRLFA